MRKGLKEVPVYSHCGDLHDYTVTPEHADRLVANFEAWSLKGKAIKLRKPATERKIAGMESGISRRIGSVKDFAIRFVEAKEADSNKELIAAIEGLPPSLVRVAAGTMQVRSFCGWRFEAPGLSATLEWLTSAPTLQG